VTFVGNSFNYFLRIYLPTLNNKGQSGPKFIIGEWYWLCMGDGVKLQVSPTQCRWLCRPMWRVIVPSWTLYVLESCRHSHFCGDAEKMRLELETQSVTLFQWDKQDHCQYIWLLCELKIIEMQEK